ncbi:MAG: flagellar basal body P-ring formation protein FlgA [Gammaproteobacteria bacterium]|nr:flagellar basal body P-ring formation protein FlgA [Gammaproteobacteria bacterium]
MFRYAYKRISLSLVAGLLLISGDTIAANKIAHQDHESIRQAASDFARHLSGVSGQPENTTISVGRLDRRLRLAKCDQPLEAFRSPNTKSHGRTTVGVRCDGNKSWKLYVSVNIQIIKPVVTIKHSVTRNSILRASDLLLEEKDISSLHRGYYTQIEKLVGKHVKNSLKTGLVVTPGHVKNPLAVKKGATVLILADAGGIQVNMKGKAMKSGSLGDWIPVQNLSSKRKIEGRILRPGVIQVTL